LPLRQILPSRPGKFCRYNRAKTAGRSRHEEANTACQARRPKPCCGLAPLQSFAVFRASRPGVQIGLQKPPKPQCEPGKFVLWNRQFLTGKRHTATRPLGRFCLPTRGQMCLAEPVYLFGAPNRRYCRRAGNLCFPRLTRAAHAVGQPDD
jgi:hypothetical protein